MYALLECVDGRRDDARARRALLGAARPQLRRGARRRPRGEARRAGPARRARAQRAAAAQPAARAALEGARHEPARDAAAHRCRSPCSSGRGSMWPVVACFVGVCWFVLFHKGVASATSEAFRSPELLLLVFALAIALGRLPRARPRRRLPLRRRRRPAAWAWASTWSGRRSTPTSPTRTGCRAATGCASTSAGSTSTRVVAVVTLGGLARVARRRAAAARSRCSC